VMWSRMFSSLRRVRSDRGRSRPPGLSLGSVRIGKKKPTRQEYLAATDDLPKGPKTIEEGLNYPATTFEDMIDVNKPRGQVVYFLTRFIFYFNFANQNQARSDNLEHLGSKYRINLRLFYVGKASCASSAMFFNVMMKRKKWADKFFEVTHGADNCGVSQSMMLCHQHRAYPGPTIKHVFGDFVNDGRVNPAILQEITGISEFAKTLQQKDSKAAAFEQMWERMCQERDSFFTGKAWCFRHGGMCPTFEKLNMNSDETATTHVDVVDDQLWRTRLDSVEGMQEAGAVEDASPRDHGDDHMPLPVAAPGTALTTVVSQPAIASTIGCGETMPKPKTLLQELSMVVGGTSCQDFCGYSSKAGLGGQTMLPFCNFCQDILVNRPACFLCEISGAEEAYYGAKMSHCYGMWSVKTEPLIEGWPAWRYRLYVFGWCRQRCAFDGCSEEYFEIVSKQCLMTSQSLLTLSPTLRQKRARMHARANGFCHPPGAKIPLLHQLTGPEYQRLQTQIRRQEALTGPGSADGLSVDVEQNSSHTRMSWAMGPLVTHGEFVFGGGSDDVLMAEEHLISQGEAVEEVCTGLDPDFHGCVNPVIKKLCKSIVGERLAKFKAGNAMAMHNLYSFMTYGMAHLKVILCKM